MRHYRVLAVLANFADGVPSVLACATAANCHQNGASIFFGVVSNHRTQNKSSRLLYSTTWENTCSSAGDGARCVRRASSFEWSPDGELSLFDACCSSMVASDGDAGNGDYGRATAIRSRDTTSSRPSRKMVTVLRASFMTSHGPSARCGLYAMERRDCRSYAWNAAVHDRGGNASVTDASFLSVIGPGGLDKIKSNGATLKLVCTCVLYANAKAGAYSCQL
eukprot:IDg15245t1